MKGKTIALIILIVLIIGSVAYLESTKNGPGQQEDTQKLQAQGMQESSQQEIDKTLPQQLQEKIAEKEKTYMRAPELAGISGYLNSQPGIKISDFRGKVVLVDFWTYTCINCIRTLPHIVEWDKKYRDMGLVIIGVHTPEFDFEKDYANVQNALKKYDIEYAVVQDNDYKTWQAFNNRFWPRKYLIDTDGFIRFDHIGEGSYDETEKQIQELLSERNASIHYIPLSTVADTTPIKATTPELYLGYDFALPRDQNIGNAHGFQEDTSVSYTLPDQREKDIVYLEGRWKSNPNNIETTGSSTLYLKFTASSLHLVASGLQPTKAKIFIDGHPLSKTQAGSDITFEGDQSILTIGQPRLYTLINAPYGEYELKMVFSDSGASLNSFTFG